MSSGSPKPSLGPDVPVHDVADDDQEVPSSGIQVYRVRSRFDAAAGRVTHVGRGRLKAQDIRAVIVATFEHESFHPRMDILWDLRAADLGAIDFSDIQDVADLVRHFWTGTNGRTAVVTARASDLGVSRKFGSFVRGLPRSFRVFETMEDAELWMGRTRQPHKPRNPDKR